MQEITEKDMIKDDGEQGEKAVVKSLRASQATYDSLKAITERDGFPNQGALLSQLISTYELAQAGKAFPDTAGNVEEFTGIIESLKEAYLNMVRMKNSAGTSARQEYAAELARKDRALRETEEKCRRITSEAETYRRELEDALRTRAELEQAINRMKEEAAARAEEKNNRFTILQRVSEEQKEGIAELEARCAAVSGRLGRAEDEKAGLEKELTGAKAENHRLVEKINRLEEEKEELVGKIKTADDNAEKLVEQCISEESLKWKEKELELRTQYMELLTQCRKETDVLRDSLLKKSEEFRLYVIACREKKEE